MAKDNVDLVFDILTGKNTLDKDLKTSQSKTNKLDNSVKKLGKSFKAVGSSIFSMRGLILSVGAAFGVSKLIQSANQQEDAINQLNIALKASGKFSNSASEDMQKFASSMQKSTKFGDEILLQNAALIQSLGHLSTDGLKEATTAAADMSAALGIDLTAAATLVGKAAAGEVGSFSRYGVVIKKGADNAATFATALEAINSKFGGAAAGQIKTFSGASQQLSNSFGDLVEEFGFIITKNPALTAGFNKLTKVISQMGAYVAANRKEIIAFVNRGIAGVIRVLPTLIRGLGDAKKGFEILGEAIKLMGLSVTAALLYPLVLLEDQINKLIDSVPFLKEKMGNFSTGVKDSFDTAIGGIKDGVKSIGRIIEEESTMDKLAKKAEESLSGIADTLTDPSFLSENIPEIKIPAKIDMAKVDKKQFKSLTDEFASNVGEGLAKIFQNKGGASEGMSKAIGAIGDMSKEGIAKSVAGGFAMISEGRAGAKKFIKAAGKAIGTAFFGPVGGQVVDAVIGPLMKAPADLAAGITDFFKSIPELLGNILINIINFDEMMVRGADALIRALPKVMESVIEALITRFADPTFWVRMGIIILKAFMYAIPAAIRAFRDGIKNGLENVFKNVGNLFKKLFKFDGGGTGPVEKFLHFDFPFMAFAKGGMVGGNAKVSGDHALNDVVPALLSPGEMVIPRSVVGAGVGSVVEFLQNSGVPVRGAFGGFIKDAWDTASGWVSDAARAATAAAAKAWTETTDFAKEIGVGIFDVFNIPKHLWPIIKSLKKIGAEFSIKDLVKAPGKVIPNAVRGVAKGMGGTFRNILQSMPLATGGTIGSGFPNDSFPASLSSNETVIRSDVTDKLDAFLEQDTTNNLLAQILDVLTSGSNQSQSIEINGREFAKILLETNRNNARVTV